MLHSRLDVTLGDEILVVTSLNMFAPEPDPAEADNLGKNPTAVQRNALKHFRRHGLWDDCEARRSARENKVKFTPAIQELAA